MLFLMVSPLAEFVWQWDYRVAHLSKKHEDVWCTIILSEKCAKEQSSNEIRAKVAVGYAGSWQGIDT